jgi:hypothetical protein
MLLLVAAALPALLWDEPPATVSQLTEAGITQVQVPAARYKEWQGVTEVSVEAADLRNAVTLEAPSVEYHPDQASATSLPWLDSNGWQFLRNPPGQFIYTTRGTQAAIAAAEAFCFGGTALVRTDRSGLRPFAAMIDFLRKLGGNDAPAIADIGFVDDGTDTAAEVMNLMVRNNLLFRVVGSGPAPDSRLKLTVRLGSKEFPLEEAAKDPWMTAHEIRAHLTDERRSLRLYGSPVVVGRLTARADGVRVHLLNYAAAARKVDGIRVRVLGNYPKHRLASADNPKAELIDYSAAADATEFTLPELKTYAVIDLSR